MLIAKLNITNPNYSAVKIKQKQCLMIKCKARV